MIIYDCEIIKAIEDKKHPRIEGIEYCDGWKDFTGMGLACVQPQRRSKIVRQIRT